MPNGTVEAQLVKPELPEGRFARALARFCAPLGSNAGEKEKNARGTAAIPVRHQRDGGRIGVGPERSFPSRLGAD